MKAYTIVNDGQMTWVAETDALIAALDAQGWERRRDVGGYRAYVEPDAPEDEPNVAYVTLCKAVEPADASPDRATMESLTYDPSRNAWVWG